MRNLIRGLIQGAKAQAFAAIGEDGSRLVGYFACQFGKVWHRPSLSLLSIAHVQDQMSPRIDLTPHETVFAAPWQDHMAAALIAQPMSPP
jgi:hypothetical protein